MHCFDFRETIKTRAITRTFLLREGNILKPSYRERSKTGAHGMDCYEEHDYLSADAILTIRISGSGKHYCELEVRKPNPASLQRVLELHDCPNIRRQLYSVLALESA